MQHTFEIAELFKNEKVSFVKNSYHTFEIPERLETLRGEYEQFKKFYPQHSIDFICPTENELRMFKEAGLESSHFVNKNGFIDPSFYYLCNDVPKEFDAVYNGQLLPYKRHELAELVDSLALIVYQRTRSQAHDECAARIREQLKHATLLNDSNQFIPPIEISKHLSRAKVGLCLSAEEGPMAACIEYLLTGLQVVSTKSLGGRDVFFDDEYVKVVDDTPEAVAAAVKELAKRDVAPEKIRERTLEKMQEHRDRFVRLINDILKRRGALQNFEEEFSKIFVNKMRMSSIFPGALLQHAAKGMPVEFCRERASQANA